MASGRPSSGWIKGIVKEVASGDTLTITSGPKLGAPEKRITLASLIAPKLVPSCPRVAHLPPTSHSILLKSLGSPKGSILWSRVGAA